ncbi:hypothetical protein Kpol_2000p91 [Vanderwaltozyma polyspora DSM 70294]|uniref:NADH:flavin oxidoreductase/NADH oxidase N-terminal domain-containing protein n=1 Tax=Vanderwaltozyma polyspora (strain ATCC 22028 / DSM 70294 / BCRC 21397 / CBS 2163 / NBRC 10782 / NRRL Y-8283 / UCD 57-17) TaxID=436907 RepID=A7TF98_VANPO|nr:uncharacterized protein Kpol_2000p91 [Vanderwaltozyma polyspora DSM 70294]EDO19123.1 hypothetical protein Kpol_2000p91 [Vanderwaltozyma polyspora DSM 70294]
MSTLAVKPCPNVPYFTPQQPVLGQFIKYNDNTRGPPPKLFESLKIRGLTFPNRIGVSPMCTYSSDNNEPTDFHQVHYGAWATRGCGMIVVECTGVDPDGLTSPNDLGLWSKHQATKHFQKIVEFAHSQNTNIGIQLGHYGLKKDITAMADEEQSLYRPHEYTKKMIQDIVKKWGHAAKLAVNNAHYDFIEIQAGHGHLISEFMSCEKNMRDDEYGGGSFATRVQLLMDVVDEVRKNIGDQVPIFLRLSTASSMEEMSRDEWSIEDTIKLSKELYEHGVDVLDITGGGHHVNEMKAPSHRIKMIKSQTPEGLKLASPGGIHSGREAEMLFEEENLDILLVGRPFLENPGLVWTWCDEMGISVNEAVQYTWGFYPDKAHLMKKK